MLLAILGFMALTSTIASYALKQSALAIIGTLFWIIFAVQSYTMISVNGDVYWAIFFGSFFFALMTGLEPYFMRDKTDEPEPTVYQKRAERRKIHQDKVNSMFGQPVSSHQIANIKMRKEFKGVQKPRY